MKGRDSVMQKPALMGIFAYLDDLVGAVQALRRANLDFTVFTPVPHHELREAISMKPSPVRYFTLCGAVFGIISGLGLAVFTVLQWKFIVSGKPIVPWVPFVIIAFEFCILLGVLLTVVGMLITTRLPQPHLPDYYDPRFSVDRFGVLVRGTEVKKEEVTRILKEAGAEEIHAVTA
jgi:molybdopterin-containing oxidoreductase family membrane subunit